ncbi:hypothetical protein DSO57_1024673 [Entomophthora muscae]|uniref:Uncharacterized protein n=1 Tax=Entomophthora muscae TaxID=34485 RepID=A0ACC2S4I3_9FUNG|nr:hypothetical protein DSO57_1024673 [Entomophthora muscae]
MSLKKILKMPDFVEHFTACSSYCEPDNFMDEYAPNFPSLHFNCDNDILNDESPYQATKVSFGMESYDGSNLHNFTSDRFPNLQNLYISDTIPKEGYFLSQSYTGGDLQKKPFSLASGFFPRLTRFSSKAPQADWFWPKLLEAAPKLQYIHTNYKPLNLLELKSQRPFLQFMPYQDIFGESGYVHYMPEFTYSRR